MGPNLVHVGSHGCVPRLAPRSSPNVLYQKRVQGKKWLGADVEIQGLDQLLEAKVWLKVWVNVNQKEVPNSNKCTQVNMNPKLVGGF